MAGIKVGWLMSFVIWLAGEIWLKSAGLISQCVAG